MKKPNKYKLHHGEFTINYEPLCGLSVYPETLCKDKSEEYWVWVNPDQCTDELTELDTLIHELLHCEHPDMSEEDVARTATNIAKVLEGEGWGKIKKKKKKKK